MNVLDPKRTRYVTALWEVDPAGRRVRRVGSPEAPRARAARRSCPTARCCSCLPGLIRRSRPTTSRSSALWGFPPAAARPLCLATRPGGVSGVVVATDSGTIVVSSDTLPGSITAEDDTTRRTARKDNKVARDPPRDVPDPVLGPRPRSRTRPRLMVGERAGRRRRDIELRDLTGHSRHGAVHRRGVVGDLARRPHDLRGVERRRAWWLGSPRNRRDRHRVRSASRLLSDADHEYASPAVSPDGSRLAFVVATRPTPSHAQELHLAVARVGDDGMSASNVQLIAADGIAGPGTPVWTAGRFGASASSPTPTAGTPVFRVDLDGGGTRPADRRPRGLQRSAGRSATAAPSTRCGRRTTAPPAPVRLGPGRRPAGPGGAARTAARSRAARHAAEVRATAADGARVQSWLVLPEGATRERPAPLVLWIHGGPLMSWNSWSWRWCPWVMAARGYAVLLPNPALSQGFGQDFVRRGWGEWGGAPYTDLMAAVDAAEQLPEIDATRTAAMGGSFGGYMANWVATQTDRFRAIVTHASLWDLDAFAGDRRTRLLLGEASGATRCARPSATSRTRRTATPTRSARRCWSSTATRTTGCRSARRCGSGTSLPEAARRAVEVPVLPRREPLGAHSGNTPRSGTRRCSPSSTPRSKGSSGLSQMP